MKRILSLTLLAASIWVPTNCVAEKAEHLPKVDPVLQPLAFLSGRWVADTPDGQQEEFWSPPMGGSMVGTFRIVKDGAAVFYEFWAIEVEGGKAIFKLKHFNRGLSGWEEKADMVRLTATPGEGQDVVFSKPDGSLTLRYQRKGNELVATLHEVKDGKDSDEVFRLHRSR